MSVSKFRIIIRSLYLAAFLILNSCKDSIIPPTGEPIQLNITAGSSGISSFDSYSGPDNVTFHWTVGQNGEPYVVPLPGIKKIKIFFSEKSPDNNYYLLYETQNTNIDSIIVNTLKKNKIYYFRLALYKEGDTLMSVSKPLMTMLGGEKAAYYSENIEQAEYPLYYSNLSWSPDGEKIAVIKNDNTNHSNLFLFNINSRTYTQLTDFSGNDYRLMSTSLSPDGINIAFCYTESRTSGLIDYRIWKLNTLNKNIKSITSGRVDADPVWFSGDRLIFCKGTYEPPNIPELFSLNLQTLAETQLTNDQSIYKYTPYVSKEKSMVLFSGRENNKYSIYSTSFNGGNIQKLTNSSTWDEIHPGIYKNKIYFPSNRSGHYEIWSMDLLTKEYSQVTHSLTKDTNQYYGTIDPTGKYMAVIKVNSEYKFFLKILNID